ncbi:hypothetical protein HDU67_009690 [Dinochytrium kinnereticum]|nr:hypothetical protein HDU67_009690 [Dinochytrium kinnereticum]
MASSSPLTPHPELPVEVWSTILLSSATTLPDLCRLSTLNRSIRRTIWSSPRTKAGFLAARHDGKDLVRSPVIKFLNLPDSEKILEILVKAKAFTFKQWPSACSYVLQAHSEESRMRILPVLLKGGFPVNPTVVIDFVRTEGRLDEAMLFLDNPSSILPVPGRIRAFHAGLITAAAVGGHLNVLQYLIETRGCDKDLVDREGRSALHTSAMLGRINAVKYLISIGCDKELRDFYGRRPVENAVVWNELTSALLLIRAGATISGRFFLLREPENVSVPLIHVAAALGCLELVKEVIGVLGVEGSGLKETTPEGRTPVHLAAYFGHVEVVRFLVEVGGELGVRDSRGRTPLCYAENRGFAKAALEMRKMGAEL